MTPEEHAETIREAAMTLNNAVHRAIADDLRVELSAHEEKMMQGRHPRPYVLAVVSKVIRPAC